MPGDPAEWRRFGKRIRELTGGQDIVIVFEHPGRRAGAPKRRASPAAAGSW